MSKWLYDFSDEVAQRLESLMTAATGKEEMRRIQAIYFRARFGDGAEMVAKRTGLTIGTVHNLHSRWRKEGEAALELKPRGGRNHAHLMPEEERMWLLNSFSEEAIIGGILEVSCIHRAYEEKIGRSVCKATVYDLLHRHGWRKVAPRPHHPKADVGAQADFKKTGQISSKRHKKKPPK